MRLCGFVSSIYRCQSPDVMVSHRNGFTDSSFLDWVAGARALWSPPTTFAMYIPLFGIAIGVMMANSTGLGDQNHLVDNRRPRPTRLLYTTLLYI